MRSRTSGNPLSWSIRIRYTWLVALALATLGVPATPARAQTPVAVTPGPDSTSGWAQALVGTWSCGGAFSSGKPLAADIRFDSELGGRWISYHHQDRAPSRYEATAVWGPALHDSALAATILYDNFGGHRRFLPAVSPSREVTLLRDTSEAGARMERFTFRPRGDDALWFAWEVQRASGWVLGDSLSCRRNK